MALVAATVKVDEPPGAIEAGLADIVTVGAVAPATVTVAVAVVLPPGPFAVAVYVTVATGLTTCVPPFACRLYVLPSVPLTVTCVALVAVTVSVDEAPAAIDVGLALIPMIGAAGGFVPLLKTPHPVSSRSMEKPDVAAVSKRA